MVGTFAAEEVAPHAAELDRAGVRFADGEAQFPPRLAAIFDKLQGPPPDELPPKVLAELDAAAKKHGFKDFNDYDEVVGNITMVMTGIDPKTKVFTEPVAAIQKEIADVTADKTIPAQDKKQMLEELNEALKSAPPIQFPGNIELVKKYYDKIDAGLN